MGIFIGLQTRSCQNNDKSCYFVNIVNSDLLLQSDLFLFLDGSHVDRINWERVSANIEGPIRNDT